MKIGLVATVNKLLSINSSFKTILSSTIIVVLLYLITPHEASAWMQTYEIKTYDPSGFFQVYGMDLLHH